MRRTKPKDSLLTPRTKAAAQRPTRPTVATVEGIRVMVHYNDHAPPHVHLSSGDIDIVIPIDAPVLPTWAFSAEERIAVLSWMKVQNPELHAAWERSRREQVANGERGGP